MILLDDEEYIKSKSSPYEWDTYWSHIFNVMKKNKAVLEERKKSEPKKQRGPYKTKKRKGYK